MKSLKIDIYKKIPQKKYTVLANLDLTFHGDAEQHDEIHYKNGPEHRHIKGFKECANHSDDNSFCC